MKKTLDQRLDEMLEEARNGTLELIPCDNYSTKRTSAEMRKRVDELEHLNDASLDDTRIIRVSRSTYTHLAKRAKRAKISVPEFLEKLAKQ